MGSSLSGPRSSGFQKTVKYRPKLNSKQFLKQKISVSWQGIVQTNLTYPPPKNKKTPKGIPVLFLQLQVLSSSNCVAVIKAFLTLTNTAGSKKKCHLTNCLEEGTISTQLMNNTVNR